MPNIHYQDWNSRGRSGYLAGQANQIILEYGRYGIEPTVRQIYYQFVSRNLVANNEKEYKKLGELINNARMCGLIDWDSVVDRTRPLWGKEHFDTPVEMVADVASQFHINMWDGQQSYVEVWIEKDALLSVIEGVCSEHDVPYMACRGYGSQSSIWRAGHYRIRPMLQAGRDVTILYLGDHDPSGLNMTEDLRKRLELFAGQPVNIQRLALNMDLVEQYAPPPNPTKPKDSRTAGYEEQFGDTCWELDALDALVIRNLVKKAITDRIDLRAWIEQLNRQDQGRSELRRIADYWPKALKAAKPRKPRKRRPRGKDKGA
jgi:hypothetical protein